MVVVASARPHSVSAEQIAGLDALVEQVMGEWHVPGLAIAVVRDGDVILAKGYGYRDLESEKRVTPDTLFAAGSISKTFTATGLAILVDEGRLSWDTKMRDVLPDFALQDETATQHATIEDLLTHRTGLARHDRLWYLGDFSRAELYARLRHLESNAPFRAGFQYHNMLFMTAGLAVERLTGKTWEEFTRTRILSPLGMKRSNFSIGATKRDADHATPYAHEEGELRAAPFYDATPIAPAGGLNTSASELARWVRLHLGRGSSDGKQLLSKARAVELHSPRVAVAGEPAWPALDDDGYGLGFSISAYRGDKMVWHNGGIDGFLTHMSFMPGRGVGVVVLANLDRTPTPTIISRFIYDRLLGLEPLPWNARFQEDWRKGEIRAQVEEELALEARKTGTRPSHALGDYAGWYEHPGYGTVRIQEANDGLTLTYGRLTAPLAHVHYDIFEIWRIPLTSVRHLLVTFYYDENGDIDRLTIPFEPKVEPIVFLRDR